MKLNISEFDNSTDLEFSPITKNMSKVMTIEGIVVIDIYFMCSIKLLPLTDGARFVVSERGDILSPK